MPKMEGVYLMEGDDQNDVMRAGRRWVLPTTLPELLRALYPEARTYDEKRAVLERWLTFTVATKIPDDLRQEIRSTYGL